MIDVGIVGVASKQAGELLRLLINHPDVQIKCASDTILHGQPLCHLHHGLIGEIDIVSTDAFDSKEVDLIFVCLNKEDAVEYISNLQLSDNQRLIDLSGAFRIGGDEESIIYGLPELNRKPLVRGGVKASIPTPAASLILISLLPLLKARLLRGRINLKLSGVALDYSIEQLQAELEYQFKMMEITDLMPNITYESSDFNRGLRLICDMDIDLSVEYTTKIYEDYYDDHNLTYVMRQPVSIEEVEGTDKCIVSIGDSPNGGIIIDSVVDAYLRGGAGDAVHVMNLLCGLQEKVGLALKVIKY